MILKLFVKLIVDGVAVTKLSYGQIASNLVISDSYP